MPHRLVSTLRTVHGVRFTALLWLATGCASAARTTPSSTDAATTAAVAAESRLREPVSGNALGVAPFRVGMADPTMSALGFALADLITTDLARSSQLQLVERNRLGDVLRELDLARTGRVDSATAPRVGKLIRASRLVFGSIDTLPGGELRLGLRLADVESGALQQALDARAPLSDILAAEKSAVFKLFDALGITLTPAERATIDTRSGTSLAALTAYGRGVQAEVLGDPRRAREEFQRSLRFDPSFKPAVERVAQSQVTAYSGSGGPAVLPGSRGSDAPVAGTVDRLNRPLDYVTSFTRPTGGPGDPAFPSTVVTVLLTIRRP